MGDPNLNGAQENLFGNYIVQRGLANPHLRDEILVQVANQVSLPSFMFPAWKKEEQRVSKTCAHHFQMLVRCGGIPTPSTQSAAGCSSLPALAPSCLHRDSPNTCWSKTLNDLSLSLLLKVRSIFRLHYFYSPGGASASVLSMIQRVHRRVVAPGTCTHEPSPAVAVRSLVAGLCLTLGQKVTTACVSTVCSKVCRGWLSGRSMSAPTRPVCWSGPPIASGLTQFCTSTALMVRTLIMGKETNPNEPTWTHSFFSHFNHHTFIEVSDSICFVFNLTNLFKSEHALWSYFQLVFCTS